MDDSRDHADLNTLQTELYAALEEEDYAAAAHLRDRIELVTGAGGAGDWSALGVPEWLSDRLHRLDFTMPTRVQLQALRAIALGEDAAICAVTGSGKSLAYLVPALTQLSDDLMQEDLSQFLTASLEGKPMLNRAKDALLRARWLRDRGAYNGKDDDEPLQTPALMVVVPTRELGVQVSLLAYRLLGGGVTNPKLQPYSHRSNFQPGGKANMFSYQGPRDVRVAGLWDEPTTKAIMLDKDLLNGVHVVVGTPEHLSRVAVTGNLRLQHLRNIIVDEADACLAGEEHAEQMGNLLRRLRESRERADGPPLRPPQTVLAGASLSAALVRRAAEQGWVRAPTLVTELGAIERATELEAFDDAEGGGGGSGGGGGFAAAAAAAAAAGAAGGTPAGGAAGAPAPGAAATAAAAWIRPRVLAGHTHEYMVCEPAQAVATLCRLLRARFETDDGGYTDQPRVVVFAPSAEAALDAASRLQGALWSSLGGDTSSGLWGLSVLLPSAEEPILTRTVNRTGDADPTLSVLESSLRVMEMFRTNQTSVLVTTAAATRGLDFPHVTDVFNLGIVGSAADYLHRAGRIGRIGQSGRGRVVSVLQPAEVTELLALGTQLDFTPREREPPPTPSLELAANGTEPLADRDGAVQTLEEIFNLYN